MSTYRTSTIKRGRRTRAQVEQLDWQILDVLADDNPQSVRHVFYRMTNPRLPEPVEKSDERGYRQVQSRIVKLRRDGRLPYGWISDSTRRGYHTVTYGSSAEFLRRVAGSYRADLWADSDWYVEVWVESRSIAGVLLNDCQELAVSLYPCGGFSSITLAYEAAEYINQVAGRLTEYGVVDGRRIAILYVGDYDPAGVLIDQALERELRSHLKPGVDLQFTRLGITPWQIEHYDLPTKPRKPGDRRALHVQETVEAEAMPAHILRALVRQAIEAHLPEGALEVAKVAEQSEREFLWGWAEHLEGRGL